MTKTFVVFDAGSGRIVSVHHHAGDATQAQRRAKLLARDKKGPTDVLEVAAGQLKRGVSYNVDTAQRKLREVAKGEMAVSFAFGATGSTAR